MNKPFLVLQLRPEDDTSDNEYRAILKYGNLDERDAHRIRIERSGACSGNGLLGAYLGTPISGKYREAVGCVRLDITDDGRQDPLLSGFPDRITVLLGHKEACDELPEGATLLMTGDACPVQMFRIGNNVYATQFHPEGDSEGFTLRIHAYKHHGYFQPHEVQTLITAVSEEDTPYAQAILSRFVARYRSRAQK
jgi:GMP synthase (glutamine-hydrolysing)